MNCQDWEDYRICLKSAKKESLHSMKDWLSTRTNEKDRDIKVLYIDLELERRAKIRRSYEN